MLIAFSVTPLGVGEGVGEIVAEAVRVVRASGLPNRTDSMFTTIEGDDWVGIAIATEMRFLRRRPVGGVDDLEALVDLGQRLLDFNKTRLEQVTTGDTRRGMENWVYRRSGRPCRRCGTPIRRGEQDLWARNGSGSGAQHARSSVTRRPP
jgi:hypothetical protein